MTKVDPKNKYIGTHRLLQNKGEDISYSVVYKTLTDLENANHSNPQTKKIVDAYFDYLVDYEKKAEANFQKLRKISDLEAEID